MQKGATKSITFCFLLLSLRQLMLAQEAAGSRQMTLGSGSVASFSLQYRGCIQFRLPPNFISSSNSLDGLLRNGVIMQLQLIGPRRIYGKAGAGSRSKGTKEEASESSRRPSLLPLRARTSVKNLRLGVWYFRIHETLEYSVRLEVFYLNLSS